MTTGGFRSFPMRFGGAVPRVKALTDALVASRGTAYDVTPASPVWLEAHVDARAVNLIWETNALLANQGIPGRMSVMLARWEKILDLRADPGASLQERNTAVLELFDRAGKEPTYQEIVDRLTVILAPVTFAIVHNAPGAPGVLASWPGGWFVSPLGTTPPAVTLTGNPVARSFDVQIFVTTGGTLGVAEFIWSFDGVHFSGPFTTAADFVLGDTGLTAHFPAGSYATDNRYVANAYQQGFSSAVGQVTIVATPPAWMADEAHRAEYYETIKGAFAILDAMMPAWVGFDVVRDGSVPGEFRLDEEHNLDNQRMSAA